MAVLQKGKNKYPFWGSSVNLITGLDPLGLQTTSEATFTVLLNGIGNLTNRLRYYGFYCWVLQLFFEKEKRGNSDTQAWFIRRADLILAILMVSERRNVQQVIGSTYAAREVKKNLRVFDIASGADIVTEKTKELYLGNDNGGFGAIYAGPMSAISLVVRLENDQHDVLFHVTTPSAQQKVSGQELAEAFEENIAPNAKVLFYNSLKSGRLRKSDLAELAESFALDKIPVGSGEWKLYVEMLMDKDEPSQDVEEYFSFHRRETISLLIKSALNNKGIYDWSRFLISCYNDKLGSSSSPQLDTAIGWYSYQLNEYWQYACGTILWGVLELLYSHQQDQYLPVFVERIAAGITNEICSNLGHSVQPMTLIAEVLLLLPDDSNEEVIKNLIDETSDPQMAITHAFLLLFRLCQANKEQLQPLLVFMKRKHTERDGNMVGGLSKIVHNEKDSLLSFVQKFVFRQIIYRHQMVATRKMGNTSQSTHKFFIEDQFIRFIETAPPKNTSPRLNAIKNMLYDLSILTEDDELSALHQKLLVFK